LLIRLVQSQKPKGRQAANNGVLRVPWHKTPSTRRREILLPDNIQLQDVRPIRSETRATLVASIARGRRWLDELTTAPTANAETIAKREHCSVRKINKTISLAFLAPDLVKAAIEGASPEEWGLPASATCPPNGRGSATYWASTLDNHQFRTRLCNRSLRFPGNGILEPETKTPNGAHRQEYAFAETGCP